MGETGIPSTKRSKPIEAAGPGVAARSECRRSVSVRRRLDRRILLLGLVLSVAVHAVALAMIQVRSLDWGTQQSTRSVIAMELPALKAVDLETARAPDREELREEADPVAAIQPRPSPQPETAIFDPPPVPPLAPVRTVELAMTDSVAMQPPVAMLVAESVERGEYEQQVARWVERQRDYPLVARHRRLEGTAVVRIQLDGDGSLVEALLVRDTGHAVLDRAALEMIRRAAPYPRVPRSLTSSPVEVLVPIQFSLSR